jgi:hypothetical protein
MMGPQRSRALFMTRHSKPVEPSLFPLALYAPRQNQPKAQIRIVRTAKETASVEPPSLEAFRAKLLPVVPVEYFEPRRGVFGWLRRRRSHFVAPPTSPKKRPFSNPRA